MSTLVQAPPVAQSILVIDDDDWILQLLNRELSYEGYAPILAAEGGRGIDMAHKHEPDLILLDLMLPDMSGIEVVRRLRGEGLKSPVLVISSRDQEAEKVRLLDAGANDYVTKPFGLPELLARVRVQLRASSAQQSATLMRFVDLEVDLARHRVSKGPKRLDLTGKEFAILRLLMERRGQIVTRDDFLDEAWPDVVVSQRTVDTHMASLRQKLGRPPEGDQYISSVRGLGYCLEEPPVDESVEG
jgi:DNA-binding response OmpR family regulator